MEVADYTVDMVYTVYTIQTALHCLNISMYICLLGNVRTLLQKVGVGDGWYPYRLLRLLEQCGGNK